MDFVIGLVCGFSDGFQISHEGARCHIWAEDFKSVKGFEPVVQTKILAEVAVKRLAGPFSSLPKCQTFLFLPWMWHQRRPKQNIGLSITYLASGLLCK